jgi:hypothetical protein
VSSPQPVYKKIEGAEIMTQAVVNEQSVMLMLKISITKPFFTVDEYQQLREIFLEMDKFINTPVVIE